jgi:hypothetical protein
MRFVRSVEVVSSIDMIGISISMPLRAMTDHETECSAVSLRVLE